MALNKVEICGVNTSKLPVLSSAKMRELLEAVRDGDKEARAKLIHGNLRLVLSVIQRFTNRGEYVDDLFQVGCVGLIKAIDNFDLGQNVKFSTYAVPMIIGEIRRYLRDNNPIRVSRSLRDIAYRALQVRDKLVSETSREPTMKEIAAVLGLPSEDVVYALDAIQEPISLFSPKSRTPASTARTMRSTSMFFETATSFTSRGSRPARAEAAAILPLKMLRLSEIDDKKPPHRRLRILRSMMYSSILPRQAAESRRPGATRHHRPILPCKRTLSPSRKPLTTASSPLEATTSTSLNLNSPVRKT
jgi:RNA polymerase sigma-G factor